MNARAEDCARLRTLDAAARMAGVDATQDEEEPKGKATFDDMRTLRRCSDVEIFGIDVTNRTIVAWVCYL